MSKTAQIVMWIVIAVLVIGGIWLWGTMSGGKSSSPAPSGSTAGTAAPAQPAADNSNQSISQSMANVDAQLGGLSSDTATVDSSLNDKTVPQQQL